MKTLKKFAIILSILFIHISQCASLNLVVFSKNRAHQLHNFLESFQVYTTGCQSVSVVYKAETQPHHDAYMLVQQAFPTVAFIKQTASCDFKALTLQAINFDEYDYILFAVDDIVVTRPIDFDAIVKILENHPATGFFLRLGEHITECYSENRVTGTPPLYEVAPGVLSWHFKEGKGDWNYPHTVDMTVYRKKDLKKTFLLLPFTNPNTLEGNWSTIAPKNGRGLCYKHAAIVNCPLNIVQTTWANRHSNECSPEELLEVFLAGYKMDIGPLRDIVNKAPHMDYKPTFIRR